MQDRRSFIKLLGTTGLIIPTLSCQNKNSALPAQKNYPMVVSTWNFGAIANEAAWKQITKGNSALDAVEAGVKVIESDTNNLTVGIGGLPDRDGKITLDACIMNHEGKCGSVAYLQNYEHPISVARKVMENTPHVMLVGDGAADFANAQGFESQDLHTEVTKKRYQEWLKTAEYKPKVNIENHDTIGMLAIDERGNISGACTTSGMAFKMAGRVGDSPIIGAGLYLDNEVGGCVATGLGEEIIRVAGSAMVVELMRHGASPQEACLELVKRVQKRNKDLSDKQVCFLAINKNGDVGAHAMYSGFEYAIKSATQDEVLPSGFQLKLS